MSQSDRNPRSIPARPSDLIPSPASSVPRSGEDSPFVPSKSGSRGVSIRLIGRAVRRHWWQALLLWTAGSAGLIALVDRNVKPTYDAVSTVKVDRGDRAVNRDQGSSDDFEVFKETQVQRLTNPNVISQALADHPDLLTLPGLANARDPEAEIRKSLTAIVVPRTNLIRVAMSSSSPEEASSVVDAVIDAFLKVALDSHDEEEAEKRRQKLLESKKERAEAVRQKREAIAELVKRVGTADGSRVRERNSVTLEQYGLLSRQLLETDLELVDAQGKLEQLNAVPSLSPLDDASEPEAEVVTTFYATPQVAEVRVKFDKARESLADAERIAKNPSEASLVTARKRVDEYQRQLDILWTKMKPSLVRAHQAAQTRETEKRDLETKVVLLKGRLAQLNDRLEKLNVQTRAAGSDELTLEFARQDLTRSEAVLDTVNKSPRPGRVRGPGADRAVPAGIQGEGDVVDRARPADQGDGRRAGGDAPGRPRLPGPGRGPRGESP